MTPEESVEYARSLLLAPMLVLIESDPHQWSTRPCQTCTAVTAIANKDFGCVKKAKEARKS